MRWIAWFLVTLLALGWFLTLVQPEGQEPMTAWRRTATGWERSDRWPTAATKRRPAIHPLVAGAFGVLCVALVLVAATPEKKPVPEPEAEGE